MSCYAGFNLIDVVSQVSFVQYIYFKAFLLSPINVILLIGSQRCMRYDQHLRSAYRKISEIGGFPVISQRFIGLHKSRGEAFRDADRVASSDGEVYTMQGSGEITLGELSSNLYSMASHIPEGEAIGYNCRAIPKVILGIKECSGLIEHIPSHTIYLERDALVR